MDRAACQNRWVRSVIVGLMVCISTTASRASDMTVRIAPTAAARADSFDWSEGEPGVWESVLDWNTLLILQVGLELEALLEDDEGTGFTFAGAFSVGRIVGGDNSDKDYVSGNLVSESFSDVEGDVNDWRAEVGYRFRKDEFSLGRTWYFDILAGYSQHNMDLDNRDLHATVPVNRSFSGDVASYDSTWEGPYLGVQGMLDVSGPLVFYGRLTISKTDFSGVADWKLRDDFAHPVSFEQEADGWGTSMRAGAGYRVSESVTLTGTLLLDAMVAEDGRDRTYYPDGTFVDIDLYEVSWSSFGLQGALVFNF